MIINKGMASKNIFILTIFVLVVFSPYVFFMELEKEIKSTEGKIEIWQEDLSRAFRTKNTLFIAKVGHTLFSDEMEWIKGFHNKQLVFSLPSEDVNDDCVIGHTFIIKHYGLTIGKIESCYDFKKFLINSISNNIFIFYFCVIIFLISFLVIIYLYNYRNGLLNFIKGMELQANMTDNDAKLAITTRDNLLAKLLEMINTNIQHRLSTQKDKVELEKLHLLNKMTNQVAHDIRSPLAALNMMLITDDSKNIPEVFRITIRNQIGRIQDVANDLLLKNKNTVTNGELIKTDTKAELLTTCIESLISEKRIEYRSFLDITLIGNIYDQASYGLFSKINLIELKRIISNLINNSIEAFIDKKGTVTISLKNMNNQFISLVVADNGRGIPQEKIFNLGQEGVSYGKNNFKQSGSGLGLYHARRTIEDCGGTLQIKSEVNRGTEIIMTLPKAEVPNWFLPEIKIKLKSLIVILDDDSGIHKIWDSRFSTINIQRYEVDVIHISNPIDFKEWFYLNKNIQREIFILSDYEFLGFAENGLNLIEDLHLCSDNSVLVTSYYESEEIRNRCKNLGVKLIPKMLAGSTPITIIHNVNCKNPENNYVQNADDNKIIILNKEYISDKLVVLISTNNELNTSEMLQRIIKKESLCVQYFYFERYHDFIKILDKNIPKEVVCFIDSSCLIKNKETVRDSQHIKHYHLFEAENSFFETNTEDDIAIILHRQREKVISKILNEHFDQGRS